jgi:uncharacterized membrane protein YfcA
MADSLLLAAAIGFGAGYLSGQFGIGGGIVTTPAIRLLLGRPELIAVGTPLPVIIPTAIAGAISYRRAGLLDARTGAAVGLLGSGFSVLGAGATAFVGGSVVLVVTAALICWMAVDMTLLALREERSEEERATHAERRTSWFWLGALGAVTGLYSGFLGLGGGFVVVPALVRWFGFSAKRAVGTSLLVVSILAVPGTITHYALGHVDLALAAALTVGVVPGALLGAHVTRAAKEKTVRIAFAVMLLAVGAFLGATELGLV